MISSRFALALGVASALGGCVKLPTPGPAPVPKPAVKTVNVWPDLASRIEQGKVVDTDELIRIVAELKRDGDIESTAAFDAAFPGITAKNIPLTETNRGEYAGKIRGIK